MIITIIFFIYQIFSKCCPCLSKIFKKEKYNEPHFENWNNPFMIGKECKYCFYFFYWISIITDFLIMRYDRLNHIPKRNRFIIYRHGKLTKYKNKLIGINGKIPITDLRYLSDKKYRKFFFVFLVVFIFLKKVIFG